VLSLFLTILPLIRGDPAFVGTLTTRQEGAIYRVIPSKGAPARWVKVGDTVDGYSVASFKEKDEILILKKGGVTYPLKLKEAKVQHGVSASAEPALIEAASKIVAKMDSWTSDMTYQVAMAPDGYWHVFVTKVIDGKTEVRRVRITQAGKATNWSTMRVEEKP